MNITHIQEDTEFAVKEATKNIKVLLGTAEEFVRPAISFVLNMVHRVQTTAALFVELLFQLYDEHLKHNVEELLDAGRDTCSQVATLIFYLYDEHLKLNVDQLLDAGRDNYNQVATPLLSKVDRKWKELSTKVHLVVSFLVERTSIHFAETCPGLASLLDIVEKHTDRRLVQGVRTHLKSLCRNPEGTSVNFLKLLGVLLVFNFAIVVRRYLLATLRTLIRVLLWPVQIMTSVVLAPFLFLFRFPFLIYRLFARSAREAELHQTDSCDEQSRKIMEENQEEAELHQTDSCNEQSRKIMEENQEEAEVHQPESCDEQSCELTEEDQEEAEVHQPESCDEQSCELTEEDQEEAKGHQADFREG